MTALLTKKNIFRFIGIVLALVALYFILPVSGPIILAWLTALALSPAVRLTMRSLNIKRPFSVMIVFSAFLLLLILLGYLLITQVITQVVAFSKNLPTYISNLVETAENIQTGLNNRYEQWNLPQDTIDQINNRIAEMLTSLQENIASDDLLNQATAIIASIPGYLIMFLVYLIALYLFMIDLPKLTDKFYSFLKPETSEKFQFMTSRLAEVILGFFKAQFLVSLIILAVTFVGLMIFTPEVAIVMSLIIWAVDFIPIIGSIAILAPWSIYMYISGDLVLGTQLLALGIVLLIIRRTVEPKVMGLHIGLSPLATLISLYLGLTLLGVVGFIVGPLAVIAFTSAREAGLIKLNFRV
ncbi:sporulation integral membrane protein YtvI [Marinococcus halophilus]|uniref:AI-2E family transporter n=1 Tax=Marinococcus halophilus TaxID=1371 RepID=A0A510Y264_MARHA|nr:sporulation integral membrane protein YtvI [Marinococcus halophilus]OZT81333.1 sporulation integral membrane protein YtvI [Marinococcus halophilus]GEK57283.1 AI-2E family transporter [Marinococcus halophilus]